MSTRTERYWYALYTRPKCEKKVASALTELQIETFLPLKNVIKIWSDRKKKLMQPLFPSYLFVYANLKERLASLQPRGTVNIVGFNGIPSRIPNDQIDAVRRVLQHGYVPEDCPYIENGDEVEVIDGPLTGLTGRVVEKRGEQHLIISLDTLYKSMSINIHPGYLRRIYPEIQSQLKPHFRN